jgi:hypothetical protein
LVEHSLSQSAQVGAGAQDSYAFQYRQFAAGKLTQRKGIGQRAFAWTDGIGGRRTTNIAPEAGIEKGIGRWTWADEKAHVQVCFQGVYGSANDLDAKTAFEVFFARQFG